MPPEFSTEMLLSICSSLPEPQSNRHKRLLPRILDEWVRTDLSEHLSRESRPTIRKRIQKLESVKRRAHELLRALEAMDTIDRFVLIDAVSCGMGRLQEEADFLAKLADIKILKLKSGRPLNLAAYLVLQDAAEIFQWFTGRKAARGVNPFNNSEAGPFFRFASAVWPIAFGAGTTGLAAAMNWATWRSQYKERSPVISNMHLRHPEWGVLKLKTLIPPFL